MGLGGGGAGVASVFATRIVRPFRGCEAEALKAAWMSSWVKESGDMRGGRGIGEVIAMGWLGLRWVVCCGWRGWFEAEVDEAWVCGNEAKSEPWRDGTSDSLGYVGGGV